MVVLTDSKLVQLRVSALSAMPGAELTLISLNSSIKENISQYSVYFLCRVITDTREWRHFKRKTETRSGDCGCFLSLDRVILFRDLLELVRHTLLFLVLCLEIEKDKEGFWISSSVIFSAHNLSSPSLSAHNS